MSIQSITIKSLAKLGLLFLRWKKNTSIPQLIHLAEKSSIITLNFAYCKCIPVVETGFFQLVFKQIHYYYLNVCVMLFLTIELHKDFWFTDCSANLSLSLQFFVDHIGAYTNVPLIPEMFSTCLRSITTFQQPRFLYAV